MAIDLAIVRLGTLVGCFPCIAMLYSSLLLTSLTISSGVEAIFQNFAAGLILAAGEFINDQYKRISAVKVLVYSRRRAVSIAIRKLHLSGIDYRNHYRISTGARDHIRYL